MYVITAGAREERLSLEKGLSVDDVTHMGHKRVKVRWMLEGPRGRKS